MFKFIIKYCLFFYQWCYAKTKLCKSKRQDHLFIKINTNNINISQLEDYNKDYYNNIIIYYNIFQCKNCKTFIVQDKLYPTRIAATMDKNLAKNIINIISKKNINDYVPSCTEQIIRQIIE